MAALAQNGKGSKPMASNLCLSRLPGFIAGVNAAVLLQSDRAGPGWAAPGSLAIDDSLSLGQLCAP